MLDGSGTTLGVPKVALAEMGPLASTCEKAKLKSDRKVPGGAPWLLDASQTSVS